MVDTLPQLLQERLRYIPRLPKLLQDNLAQLEPVTDPSWISRQPAEDESAIEKLFPHTFGQPKLSFIVNPSSKAIHRPLRIGVLFSGGQAPGGHNVITGLYDALQKLHTGSRLLGFLGGPSGILNNKYCELTAKALAPYRNQGGFDLLGSGRTKIETPEQYQAAETTLKALALDTLVIIGGDDSNTNAALLAEYFRERELPTRVIGIPKTIDGDLKNDQIEISFGFDTACKTYAETIGNILRDSLSAKKYYFFIKLMGRSASHIALECALRTHPNLTLIGEEIAAQHKSLKQVTDDICDMICTRAAHGKDYGVVLIPEGVIEFIQEFKKMIQELNVLLASGEPHSAYLEKKKSHQEKAQYILGLLSSEARTCFESIPAVIQEQLLLDRDSHGNVQVSKIETERLFIETVRQELLQRKEKGLYSGKFDALPHFCGYEGRSGFPSNFDANYSYALGHIAALLASAKATGYIASLQRLAQPVEEWIPAAVPITNLLTLEQRQGKIKPVIRKTLVDLNGNPFQAFCKKRQAWALNDIYQSPGPIQFFGPPGLCDSTPLTLLLETLK